MRYVKVMGREKSRTWLKFPIQFTSISIMLMMVY